MSLERDILPDFTELLLFLLCVMVLGGHLIVVTCYTYQFLDVASLVQGQMKLERQQILSLFIKVMKKFHKYLYGIASKEIESTMPRMREVTSLVSLVDHSCRVFLWKEKINVNIKLPNNSTTKLAICLNTTVIFIATIT